MHYDMKTNSIFQKPPFWLFAGAFLVLFPIFFYLTMENINRQEENSARILLEKGAALIRSFEAGTRMGMRGRYGANFKLQKLLEETVQLPDIAYLMVTTLNGRILAHGNPESVGLYHGTTLDLKEVASSESLKWRLLTTERGEKIFEVYGRFSPSDIHRAKHHDHLMAMHKILPPPLLDPKKPGPSLAIFVGLDTRTVFAAQTADTRQTIIMGGVFLLLAFSGVSLLLLMLRYRFTKASLSRVQAFSDNLVENMPAGLVSLDPDRKVVSINRVAGKLLGLASTDAVGKAAAVLLPAPLSATLDRVDHEKGVYEAELDCELGAEVVPVEVATTVLRDQTGRLMGHLILFRDQREIQSLRKEIARNQRLVTVGRLAAGIAHEIRNPLSSIKGFATYFKQQYEDRAEDREIADIMIQEVERLNTVVGQLLEFARPVSVQKKKTSVNALVADSLKLVERKAAQDGISLKAVPAADDPKIDLDANRVNQVLLNLLKNAMEAMPEGGTLTVTVQRSDDGNGVAVAVSDSGCGIADESLPHVYDLYYTTKPTGTGLGLAIVHNIVEAHGGKITVDSIEGKGSTFTVYLP